MKEIPACLLGRCWTKHPTSLRGVSLAAVAGWGLWLRLEAPCRFVPGDITTFFCFAGWCGSLGAGRGETARWGIGNDVCVSSSVGGSHVLPSSRYLDFGLLLSRFEPIIVCIWAAWCCKEEVTGTRNRKWDKVINFDSNMDGRIRGADGKTVQYDNRLAPGSALSAYWTCLWMWLEAFSLFPPPPSCAL